MEKKYPIGGYAPGNYHNRCCTCKRSFFGDKEAVQCESCAAAEKESFDASGEQIIANQVAGMPLEEAIFQAGYTAGVEFQKRRQVGAVWVKASEFKYDVGTTYHAKDSESKGAGRFNKDGAFIWGDGTITWPKDREDLLILDEGSVKDDWIRVEDRLPEMGEYVMVYNTEGATLVGRLMSNGWVAMFADGERLMEELTATHWRPLPGAPGDKRGVNK